MADYFGSFAGGLQLGQQYGANQAMMRERQAQIEMMNQQRRLALAEQQAVSNAMQEAGGDPTKTLNILNMRGFGHLVPKLAEGFAKQAEVETKTRGEQFGLAEKKSKQLKSELSGLYNKKDLNPMDVMGVIQRNVKLGMLTPEEGQIYWSQLGQIQDPEQLRGAIGTLFRSMDLEKFAAPKMGQVDLGGQRGFTATDPLTGKPVVTDRFDITMSPAEKESQRHAKAMESQGWANVNLRRQEFEHKKATEGPGVKLTEAQGNAVSFLNRMRDAEAAYATARGKDGAPYVPSESELFARDLPGGNRLLNANAQKVINAQKAFVAGVLRKESGAAVSPSEWREYGDMYFPRAGDTPEVISQKETLRQSAQESLGIQAGPAGLRLMEAARSGRKQAPPRGGVGLPTFSSPNDPEFKKLPSGSRFIGPDGVERKKI